jgi:putative tryptophan/tyrosine transport system substrate-binding protein
MSKKAIGVLLIGFALAWVHLAEAQQPTKKIPRVGFLSLNPASVQKDRVEAFREALRKLGYVEGQNINIEYRYADSKSERLPELAAELVALKVDVIVTTGNSATAPAKDATKAIPIVMMNDTDPVGQGHIDSLARPGGNITGLSSVGFDLAAKRLELLKEIVPKLSRVAVLRDLTNQAAELAGREIDPTARALKLQVQWFDLAKVEDFDGQFRAITKWRAGGLVAGGGPLMVRYRKRIIEFAAKNKLPAIYDRQEFVEDGGLLNYSASIIDLTRRSATYVDKILKGTKPADLPVEQPMKFEFIINLKAAKQIGLTIPPNVLARADKVIK